MDDRPPPASAELRSSITALRYRLFHARDQQLRAKLKAELTELERELKELEAVR